MNYTRQRALDILKGGSTSERLQLFFAEAELLDLGIESKLRLSTSERMELERLTREQDNALFQRTAVAYSNVLELSFKTNYYIQVLCRQKNYCFMIANSLAMAETVETAVNLALSNIEDYEKRAKVAEGIAKNTTMYGCVLDSNIGYVRVNTEAKNLPGNLEAMRKEGLKLYAIYLEDYKSIYKAINDFIDTMDVKLVEIKKELQRDYDTLEDMLGCTIGKFTDKQQSALVNFPPVPAGVKPMLEPYATMVDWYKTKADKKKVARFNAMLMRGLDN